MSTFNERRAAISEMIGLFLEGEFQRIERHMLPEGIRTTADTIKVRNEALALAVLFKQQQIRMPRFAMNPREKEKGPPHDAATATGMYDHDDGG
jgi:hypothetical protein